MWKPRMHYKLAVYRALHRLPVGNSFSRRLLLVCFVGTHIPLIATTVWAIGLSSEPVRWMEISVMLAATLVGTGVTLGVLALALAPVSLATRSLQAYLVSGCVIP